MSEFTNADVYEEVPEKDVDVESIKCPNCGNNLKFNPKTQKLFCEYCDTEVEFDQNFNYEEKDLFTALNSTVEQWTETRVFLCENCGAKVVLKKTETATSCPFCGTPHVVPTEETAGIKPNVVVPFQIDEETALDELKKWAKKKLFAPKKFKKTISPENVKGIYLPCYTYDSQTASFYSGKIGKRHTRTVGSGKNRRTQTYIVWRYISGNFNRFFNDVTITAGSKIDQKTLNKLGYRDASFNRVYDYEFLLGYMAYGAEKTLSDGWNDAKVAMDEILKKEILSQYSYDVVSYLNVSTSHSAVTYKYVMLPVYVGNYKYGKKVYNFTVNGVTGNVTGKYPVSPVRVSIAVTLGLAVVGGIVALIYLNGGFEEVSLITQNL